jgi:hypothetical protein
MNKVTVKTVFKVTGNEYNCECLHYTRCPKSRKSVTCLSDVLGILSGMKLRCIREVCL